MALGPDEMQGFRGELQRYVLKQARYPSLWGAQNIAEIDVLFLVSRNIGHLPTLVSEGGRSRLHRRCVDVCGPKGFEICRTPGGTDNSTVM